MEQKCPSASPTYNPNDIFEVACPKCGTEIEFFGDDRGGFRTQNVDDYVAEVGVWTHVVFSYGEGKF